MMDLGEQLAAVSERIYACAHEELEASGVGPTLALVIMENVTGRFRADAYATVNMARAAEAAAARRKEREKKETEANGTRDEAAVNGE